MSVNAAIRLPLHPPPAATPPGPEPLLLDALTAARLLGISPRSLWALTARGEIPCRRIGRRVLYSRAVLEVFARGS